MVGGACGVDEQQGITRDAPKPKVGGHVAAQGDKEGALRDRQAVWKARLPSGTLKQDLDRGGVVQVDDGQVPRCARGCEVAVGAGVAGVRGLVRLVGLVGLAVLLGLSGGGRVVGTRGIEVAGRAAQELWGAHAVELGQSVEALEAGVAQPRLPLRGRGASYAEVVRDFLQGERALLA